jgi:hypothetical protein
MKIFFSLFLLWSTYFIATAQTFEVSAPLRKLTFAVQPMQLLNYAFRSDVEVRLGNTRSWVQFGATGYPFTYSGDVTDEFGWLRGDEYQSMWGYGLDLNYKYFFTGREKLYVAGGPSYHYFNVKYLANAWSSFEEDGLEYHEYKYDIIHRQQIHRLGANVTFGYQKITRHAFLFNVFSGLGYRYGIVAHKNQRAFDANSLSFGHKGLVFLLGVRFGVGLRYRKDKK